MTDVTTVQFDLEDHFLLDLAKDAYSRQETITESLYRVVTGYISNELSSGVTASGVTEKKESSGISYNGTEDNTAAWNASDNITGYVSVDPQESRTQKVVLPLGKGDAPAEGASVEEPTEIFSQMTPPAPLPDWMANGSVPGFDAVSDPMDLSPFDRVLFARMLWENNPQWETTAPGPSDTHYPLYMKLIEGASTQDWESAGIYLQGLTQGINTGAIRNPAHAAD